MKEYNLTPYPRKLWVEILSEETINKVIKDFVFTDNTKITKDNFEAGGASTKDVINKKGNYGILVVFSPEAINSSMFAHEAFHVADFVADACGLDYVKETGNEHIAYLIGYIVQLFEDWKNKVILK